MFYVYDIGNWDDCNDITTIMIKADNSKEAYAKAYAYAASLGKQYAVLGRRVEK